MTLKLYDHTNNVSRYELRPACKGMGVEDKGVVNCVCSKHRTLIRQFIGVDNYSKQVSK